MKNIEDKINKIIENQDPENKKRLWDKLNAKIRREIPSNEELSLFKEVKEAIHYRLFLKDDFVDSGVEDTFALLEAEKKIVEIVNKVCELKGFDTVENFKDVKNNKTFMKWYDNARDCDIIQKMGEKINSNSLTL